MKQRLAFQEAKEARLQKQISEMGLEHQCHLTQIDSLQEINKSMSVQIQKLEKQLIESKTKVMGKFGQQNTPRIIKFEHQGSERGDTVRK